MIWRWRWRKKRKVQEEVLTVKLKESDDAKRELSDLILKLQGTVDQLELAVAQLSKESNDTGTPRRTS